MPGEEIEKSICDEEESVAKLRKLLSENEKLSVLEECDEAYLKRYLYSTNFVVERAFKKMKMFYDLLGEHPQWFTTDPPTEKKNIIEQDIRILTREHDNQGRPIYIVKIGNMNANAMDLVGDVVPVDDFFIEYLLSTDPAYQHGICVIIDVSNLPWNILKWLTPGNIKVALRRMQTMPLKEYKIHVVNSSRILNIAVNIIWPFLPQQIKDGIQFHFDDWDSLHKHVNKEVLPPEFGGYCSMDFTKLREELYERDVEIANNLRINRQPYLHHIEKNICKH
ncbi:retinaldehyde-binding protein 1 [Anoplophora glabripennis]|uniref:retinaldehyde-binding protein 1 n=1 Tax=Anoplophora glabripennis TaxID=217634 RepID=UPI000874DBC0|nr:retinaldehyde-binding protein 1 [Anoplophora glabripennis]